nr:hypothetical protein [uncultured Sphaerochaeta sp.]
MDSILNLCLSGIISFTVAIITVKIEIASERKGRLPKLILSQSEIGFDPFVKKIAQNAAELNGYFNFQRKLDDEFYRFLQINGVGVEIKQQHFLECVMNSLREKTYISGVSSTDKLVKNFSNNPEFLRLVKTYQAYYERSLWEITIENVGESVANHMRIDFFKENNSGGANIPIRKNLHPGEKQEVALIYLDTSKKIDMYKSRQNGVSYLLGPSKKWMTFYLVEKPRYNHIDERLFCIRYTDLYGKKHQIYCCSKPKKKKDFFGLD